MSRFNDEARTHRCLWAVFDRIEIAAMAAGQASLDLDLYAAKACDKYRMKTLNSAAKGWPDQPNSVMQVGCKDGRGYHLASG